MPCPLYQTSELIAPHKMPFIYSHAQNRRLSPVSHRHDFYEIIYLFAGKARHCINGMTYDMEEGDVAFLRPMEQHVFYDQTEKLELFSISVTVHELHQLLEGYHILQTVSSAEASIRFSLSLNQQHTLLSIFRQLDTLPSAGKELQIRIILGETIHEYMKQLSGNSNEWIDLILAQMRQPEHLREGVPAFLRLSNLSHPQLCRVIKKHTGHTPQQYIKELRMHYAYDLILSTALPYEEISLLAGYSSFSHFATSFKQRYGITPSALRKRSLIL